MKKNKSIEKLVLVVFILIFAAGFYLIPDTGTGNFRNGQAYRTFSTDDLKMKYPSWDAIDKSRLLEPEKIVLAVSSRECAVVVNKELAPEGATLNDLYDEYVQSRIKELKSRIIDQGAGTSSYLYEELPGEKFVYRSFTRTYLSSLNNFYKIYMISEKSGFAVACAPILEEIFENIKLK